MSSETNMRAIVVAPGGGVVAAQVPRPVPGAEQVLVRVRAAAVNRADLHVAAGHKHGSTGGAGAVIGIEWAGEVAGLGSAVPGDLRVGDAVMCSGTGAFAEYAVADWGRVYPLPMAASGFTQAAALPVALQTAHEALTASGALQRGQSVLVQGASSSVGLMCLQMARALGADVVVGTSTTDAKRARLAEFGATLSLDSRDPQWVARVLDATQGHGVDLLVDFIAGALMNANMQATRVCGHIVNVGRMGGFRGEFDFDLHSLRRIRYIGATFRTRSLDEVRHIAARMRADLWPALSAGQLALPVSATFALADAAEALRQVADNRHFGKVVLTV